MSDQSNLGKNTVYNAVRILAAVLYPIITFPYASRVLMPESLGKVNFAQTFSGYFAIIASLGITTYAVRESVTVKHDRLSLSRITSQIFSINIWTTLVSYTVLVIMLLTLKSLRSHVLLIAIASMSILFTTIGADWLNMAMEDFRYITLRTVVLQLISIIAMFCFVRSSNDYVAYLLISTMPGVIGNILNVSYRKKYCSIVFSREIEWKKHMPPILLLFFMILSQQILVSTDITMIGLMRGDYEVGLYSTAVKIENIVSQIVFSITWVLIPRLSTYFANGLTKERDALLKNALSFTVGLGFPCIAGILGTSRTVVLIVAGQEYLLASPILMMLMGALLFDLFGGGFIGNLVLLPSGKEKVFLGACIAAAVANVVLNFLFISQYGMFAAAGSTLVSRILMLLILVLKLDKNIRIQGVKHILLPPFFGSIAIYFVAMIMKMFALDIIVNFALTVVLSTLVYALVLRVLRFELMMRLEAQLRIKFSI